MLEVPMQRSSLAGGKDLVKDETGRRVEPSGEARILDAGRREKPRMGMLCATVPQTDTGRRGEKPKVLE